MNKRLLFKSHGSYDVAERGPGAVISESPFHFPCLNQTNSTSHVSSILSPCLECPFSKCSPRITFWVKLPSTNPPALPVPWLQEPPSLPKAGVGYVHHFWVFCPPSKHSPSLCCPLQWIRSYLTVGLKSLLFMCLWLCSAPSEHSQGGPLSGWFSMQNNVF